MLPISTKNMLEESRVLQYIQRWAQSHPLGQPTEQDGYSSESTSRAHTPLNTPDGPPAKLAPELDGDTPKRAVYRRLKIISENSLDSALSDGSKVSDGKEEDEEEEEVEEEPSQDVTADTAEKSEISEEMSVTPELPVKQEASDAVESSQAKLEINEEDVEQDKIEVQETEEKPITMADENLPALMEENCEREPAEIKSQVQTPAIDQPHDVKAEDDSSPSVRPPDESTPSSQSSLEDESVEPSANMAPAAISSAPTEPLDVNMPSDGIETTPESTANPESSSLLNLDNIPPSSGTSSAEKTSAEVSAVTVESSPSVSAVVTAEVLPLGIVAAEGTVVGTPSQDEEEAVSDVESERSQEPQIGAADISEMATRLLDSWKDLKARLYLKKKISSPIVNCYQ